MEFFIRSVSLKRKKGTNQFCVPCVICGKNSKNRISIKIKYNHKIQTKSVCLSEECLRKAFNITGVVKAVKKFKGVRDKGLRCNKCLGFMHKGIVFMVNKESSWRINNFKQGVCYFCLKRIFT